MNRIPLKYKSERQRQVLTLEARTSKRGDVFFLVSWDDEKDYICFKHMSSALDFINTNFNIDGFGHITF